MDAGQRAAIVEYTFSNARDAVANLDAGQRAAIFERILSNARDAVRDLDAGQRAAIVERIISNARDAVRDLDARQRAATPEHRVSNARDAVPDRDARQRITVLECITINDFGIGMNLARGDGCVCCIHQNHIRILRIAKIFGLAVGVVLQIAATLERISFNARDAGRNLDAGQRAAIVERILSNARDAVADCNAGQRAGTAERIPSNARDAVPKSDTRKVGTIVERTIRNVSTRHRDRFQRRGNIVIGKDSRRGATSVIVLCCFCSIGVAGPKEIAKRILIGILCRDPRTVAYKRNRHALERRATGEDRASNARNAVRDLDAGQRGAILERIISNARDTIGDRDASQGFAIAERPISNTRHAIPLGRHRRDADIGIGAGSDASDIAGSVAIGDKFEAFAINQLRPFFDCRISLCSGDGDHQCCLGAYRLSGKVFPMVKILNACGQGYLLAKLEETRLGGVWKHAVYHFDFIVISSCEAIGVEVKIFLRRRAVVEDILNQLTERDGAVIQRGRAVFFVVAVLQNAVFIQLAVGDFIANFDIGFCINILRHHLGRDAGEIVGVVVVVIPRVDRQDGILRAVLVGFLLTCPHQNAFFSPHREVFKFGIIDDVNVVIEGQIVSRNRRRGRFVGGRSHCKQTDQTHQCQNK